MFLGLFLSITRYYPQIWSIFCYIQLVLLVLPQKKWCELRAKPKKCHFSLIFGRYLKFTQIWCLRGSAVKRDKKWKFWWFFDMIGVRTYCFDDISSNMHYKGGKSAKFCLFKMINLTKIAFLDLILPISRYFLQIWSFFG